MNADNVVKLTKQIKVMDKRTTDTIPWDLYEDQEKVLRLLCDETALKKTVILKIRQVGMSWLCAYYLAVFVIANPGKNVAIMAQSHEVAKKLLRDFKNILQQLSDLTGTSLKELAQTNADRSMILTRSSGQNVIDTYSAEAPNGPRGNSYSVFWCSEAGMYSPKWDLWGSIKPTLALDGQLILESTAQPTNNLFRQAWENESGDWNQIFCGLEAARIYRSDEPLTGELWEEAQTKYEFTDPYAAAWWYRELASSNTTSMQREYPVRDWQAWVSAAGKWISKEPPIRFNWRSASGTYQVYEEYDPTVKYIASMDTALGKGVGDNLVVLVWNTRNKTIAASYCANDRPPEWVVDQVVKPMHEQYKLKWIYVEENGVGHTTVLALKMTIPELPRKCFAATEESKLVGLTYAQQWVEAGGSADRNLLLDCRDCHIKTSITGAESFGGRKDFLSAIGFIGFHRTQWETLSDIPDERPHATLEQFDARDLYDPKYINPNNMRKISSAAIRKLNRRF